MGLSTKSLKGQHHELADSLYQLTVLQQPTSHGDQFPAFAARLKEHDLYPLTPTGTTILQINVGKMCNQTCKHCHVDAGPDRKEIMTRDTMQLCLDALQHSPQITTVDLTGGAPEMNPDFRWFVEELSKLGRQVIVRCNLTIILANKKYHDLPEFFQKHKVHVVSSLPYFMASRTDAQRGDGVFEKSIKALQMLNAVSYGKKGSGLLLDLVYNPSGAFLPSGQKAMEAEFKRRLKSGYGIEFNNLFCITNLPISRFLDYLVQSGNYEGYMQKLVESFNPVAASGVMCRNTISVGWDGYLYDCDFNQMLDLKVANTAQQHIRDFEVQALDSRHIILNQHCYGCTAGAGSSCGGETVK
ncbi:arsenosugar biosynthesis radical SAM (seleno)protein ArsS [Pontibacter cellulosilyticus]|uniref:Arsenosugar biosynthesis radical SAM protein ArsS n=1 Tax=Pontibacter cellulosilyticus TaxID=1720253 RepID=A0A923NCI0_9BACT|nr:arsenosugar biosynthesis radical SAM (seleno)protein ArsS [Pontibacter cellulosilyticus]MBC5994415.1 arsenosugar biosynthesis radical SAM protein ArsS [Pontibacter cellulosilyticus]